MVDLKDLLVEPKTSFREVIACIDRNTTGIALVVDDERRLLGTITDGDIRRAIMDGVSLDATVQALLESRKTPPHASPLTALVGTHESQLIQMMNTHGLRHIPLLDHDGRLVRVVLLADLVKQYELPLRAVVMAGGYGTRLRPLTDSVPKPMLPVGNRPLLELLVEQLREAGVRRLKIATHYKGDLISKHFGDGQEFGMEIQYVEEGQPLGTAGALGLLENSQEPLLVINGDILTRLDFRAMLDFHREQRAEITVAVKQIEFQVPFGVIDVNGVTITDVSEKPMVRLYINAGIYLLNPEVCRYIPSGQPYDMPDLIRRLVAEGRQVVSFPVREYWLDIGQVTDYHKAQADMEKRGV